MTRPLIKLSEPCLLFRHGQAVEDPRDGLTLFGPLDQGATYGIRAGAVGTQNGITRFKEWVTWVQSPIRTAKPIPSRPPFPGFETAFRVPWPTDPIQELVIDEAEIQARAFLDEPHQRVFQTVELFAGLIIDALRQEERKPDLWFVVIPDYVRQYCRPNAVVDPNLRQKARKLFGSAQQAKRLFNEPSLFPEQNEAAEPYFYKEHFRNQFKARMLPYKVATQVVRESTLANIGPQGATPQDRAREKRQSEIAWNISTTAFYKAGGRPWKVSGIREGVCYIGLVFKRDDRSGDSKAACCGAQMFLDSGDGVVFRGAVGPWYNADTNTYHLSRTAARELVSLALNTYRAKHNDRPPREVFIHGQVEFNEQEWEGFVEATPAVTNIVGVKIRDDASLKLFRKADRPVLRGIAHIRNQRNAHLWTRGWTPRLATYPGREVPNPLSIMVCRGEATIETVLADVLALTKLNYNACVYGDGKPITLKFANAVGEVLTAGPTPEEGAPLPFMYYI